LIRVLVVAPSAVARAGLADVVNGDPGLDLVGTTTASESAARSAELEPDVILEQRAADARADGDLRTPSVVLVDDPQAAWESERYRRAEVSHSILSRDASADEIVAALVASAAGLIALQPRALVREMAARELAEPLTPRERDVLERLARGAGNKAIATQLRISEHTVKFHVASVFAKLGVSSRAEAVSRGVQLGLLML
jgi:two-component system, NarL family, response regulator YdfI